MSAFEHVSWPRARRLDLRLLVALLLASSPIRGEHVTGRGERQNCRAGVEYGGFGKQRARPSGTHRLEPVTP